MSKQAKERIRIIERPEESGWCLFDTDKGKVTIILQSSIKMNDMGEGFRSSRNGFISLLPIFGMTTAGWDCPIVLNLGLMRPIFSTPEAIQIKGSETCVHKFEHKFKTEFAEDNSFSIYKAALKKNFLFATREYFEKKYQYDKVLNFSAMLDNGDVTVVEYNTIKPKGHGYKYEYNYVITFVKKYQVDFSGMKVNRTYSQQLDKVVEQNANLAQFVEERNLKPTKAILRFKKENTPSEFHTVENFYRALEIDQKISWPGLLELRLYRNQLKVNEDWLSDEFEKYMSPNDVSMIQYLQYLRYCFYAYVTNQDLGNTIDKKAFTELYHNPIFNTADIKSVDGKMKSKLPYYIKTCVPINKFFATELWKNKI